MACSNIIEIAAKIAGKTPTDN